MRSFLAGFKLFLFFLLSCVIVPLQLLVLLVHKGRGAYILPCLWHKGVCAIFGLKVQVEGQPIRKGQVLYVANHLSYLDIPVIGTVLKASFVAKKDVASWPVFGFLSKLQQTAFIDRARGAAARERSSLGGMIAEGKSLIIFPEGTSTDGRDVLPFKSSLFALALEATNEAMQIQPLTLRADVVDGLAPETQELRDIYAWHRDMDTELPTHLWLFAMSKGAVITLTFHEAVPREAYEDRKTLAKTCHEHVSNGLHMKQAA